MGVGGLGARLKEKDQTFLVFDLGCWYPQLEPTAAGPISAQGRCGCGESKELAPGGTKGRESRLGLSRLLLRS